MNPDLEDNLSEDELLEDERRKSESESLIVDED